MIQITKGDVLSADVEALVNTVNCVGISGRGVSLQFRKALPENYKAYAAACQRGEVQPGHMFVFETGRLTNPRYVINFPTKRHWRGKSRLEDIELGLEDLVRVIRSYHIGSIAVPPLGSGLGGLNWMQVRPKIEAALGKLPDVEVIIFEPTRVPEIVIKPAKVPKMTAGRAALVGLVRSYLAGLMDPFISLLEVHKLMYFMQEAGEPLRLRYAKALYGPYAENLRHVLISAEGYYTSGYHDGGDRPDKQLELVPGAVEDAERFLNDHPEIRSRFDQVADLVQGFESPFGLELLSSVHWVAEREGVSTADEAINRVYAWSERKHRFSDDQIRLAWGVLRDKGWLSAPRANKRRGGPREQ